MVIKLWMKKKCCKNSNTYLRSNIKAFPRFKSYFSPSPSHLRLHYSQNFVTTFNVEISPQLSSKNFSPSTEPLLFEFPSLIETPLSSFSTYLTHNFMPKNTTLFYFLLRWIH